ncbi:Cyclohexadienyl dehydrogenase [Planctomycetales bacterium 10988]|nr:Cyclohexadienyl dehydrogenase [Planctomycetales bacterium 10988]
MTSYPPWNRIAIVGVGLIGGSIGLALQTRQLADHVIGIGRSKSTLKKALECGVVTEATTDLKTGVQQADLVIVCTPVSQIVPIVKQVATFCKENTLITDAGSTKAALVRELGTTLQNQVRFLGSHPIAGSEASGPQAAMKDLFENRPVVITPTEETVQQDVLHLKQFWQALGCQTVELSPEEHDRILALTSHLPHFVASSLAATIQPDQLTLSGGGYRDTTRIAAGSPHLWTQIFLENREELINAIEQFRQQFDRIEKALEASDSDQLFNFLSEAQQNRNAMGN